MKQKRPSQLYFETASYVSEFEIFLYQLARTVTDDYIVNFGTSSELLFESFFGSGDECFV